MDNASDCGPVPMDEPLDPARVIWTELLDPSHARKKHTGKLDGLVFCPVLSAAGYSSLGMQARHSTIQPTECQDKVKRKISMNASDVGSFLAIQCNLGGVKTHMKTAACVDSRLECDHLSVVKSNHTATQFTTFLLTGVPGLEDLQIWISLPFSFMYLLAVIGNGLVMAVVAQDRSLHEPMYLFLAMLALNDVLLCTVTVPQMLLIFWKGPSLVTFPACLTQMFFVHALFLSESAVLLAMAFDRYVAICAPLHYATLLTSSLIAKVGLVLVARSVAVVTPGVLLVLRLHFCRSNIIRHTYCENMGIAKLACNSIALNSIYGLTAALLTTGLDFVLISLSYWLILKTVFRLPSREARKKAFGTCGAHLCVILLFYTLAFFSFFTHRFGHHVPGHILILLANLYLLMPPTLNPIVYGVKTKEIRVRVLGLCSQLK
ncbi:olfactory receptor 52Z1P-like [Lepus europaeus]|uniref:olfactory receptor 52Z1P-like n=1 Tax=Lepus europaeus TaxID=9983 RepID=UPI002B460D80|nr:olfactory receptor 52Z1P-like [Lepus europaeus]